MTMKVKLPDEVEAVLLAKAREGGVSLEEFVESVLSERAEDDRERVRQVERIETGDSNGPQDEPYWKRFMRHFESLPEKVLERLPQDGAAEHDHYIYGWPKKYS